MPVPASPFRHTSQRNNANACACAAFLTAIRDSGSSSGGGGGGGGSMSGGAVVDIWALFCLHALPREHAPLLHRAQQGCTANALSDGCALLHADVTPGTLTLTR
jgi:hypothetical protein